MVDAMALSHPLTPDPQRSTRPRALAEASFLALPLLILGYLVLSRPSSDPHDSRRSEPAAVAETVVSEPLRPADMPRVAQLVEALWRGTKATELSDFPTRFGQPAQPIFVAARSGGRRQLRLWQNGKGTTLEELQNLIARVKKKLTSDQIDGIDTLQIDFSHSFRKVGSKQVLRRSYVRTHRAQRGLEIRRGDDLMRYGPSRMIATNRGAKRMREVFRDRYKLSQETLNSASVAYRSFEAEQVLVELGDQPVAHLLQRGNDVVAVSQVGRESMGTWAELAAGYLRHHVHADGRMTYKYWPSILKESAPSTNNMIRQWMATVALGKYAADRDDQATWELSEKNIDYNLGKFYHKEGEFGVIEWNGKVKLGALGLATIALVEHPKREKWADQEAALRRSIDSLWHEDGSFTTFFKPKGRNDNTNFYPGEALLLWAMLYERDRDERQLDRFMKSFRYYRAWHLDAKNRNPAFIPWHTQADYIVWSVTKNEELRDFVFEMNDWLLGIQQWDDTTYDDAKGRFYATKRAFGPPHASATGVYIEGLIDAYRLAKAVGDTERTEAYRLSLVRGMRSMLQLQFVDAVDMSYIAESKRGAVRGGLRTTVYDNQIRCDNVQHPLMGILKVLRSFGDGDYRHPG